jgi:predicted nucleic acid-binding Zn ribbon protein
VEAASGTVTLSDEYLQLARQRQLFGTLLLLLVLVAVFLMVVKPGA